MTNSLKPYSEMKDSGDYLIYTTKPLRHFWGIHLTGVN